MRNIFSKLLTCALVLLLVVGVFACATKHKNTDQTLKFSSTDYSDPDMWLRYGGGGDKAVDTFAVYPTVAFIDDEVDKPYVRIENPIMRQSAEAWLGRVDEIITSNGNIYAPLYSQLNGVMLAQLNQEQFESYTFATPREDVYTAFDYFLTHINKGDRPFILFGHSQGAALVGELATKFLGNKKYSHHNKNHIITYAVGFSITQSSIANNASLSFSQRSDDHSVIVSWNTTSKNEVTTSAYTGFGTWNQLALVTNPISWETGENYVPASANKASMVPQGDGTFQRVEAYADAQVDKTRGILITTVSEEGYSTGVPNIGIFHQHDMNFYHDSIRDNIRERIETFIQK